MIFKEKRTVETEMILCVQQKDSNAPPRPATPYDLALLGYYPKHAGSGNRKRAFTETQAYRLVSENGLLTAQDYALLAGVSLQTAYAALSRGFVEGWLERKGSAYSVLKKEAK